MKSRLKLSHSYRRKFTYDPLASKPVSTCSTKTRALLIKFKAAESFSWTILRFRLGISATKVPACANEWHPCPANALMCFNSVVVVRASSFWSAGSARSRTTLLLARIMTERENVYSVWVSYFLCFFFSSVANPQLYHWTKERNSPNFDIVTSFSTVHIFSKRNRQ